MTEENQRELVALLWQIKPIVYRAAQGGKKPHVQDKLDAEIVRVRLDVALARHPKPASHVSDDGLQIIYKTGQA